MNRLAMVFSLHRDAVCPICSDSLRSEVIRVRQNVAICAICDEADPVLPVDELIGSVLDNVGNGWWSRVRGVLFLTPPVSMLANLGYAIAARCACVPDVRVHVQGDGDGI